MAVTAGTGAPRRRVAARRPRRPALLLSLPALLVCIGILVPFITAVWLFAPALQSRDAVHRAFIWFENYIDFFTDPAFWNTIRSRSSTRSSPSAWSWCWGSASPCCWCGAPREQRHERAAHAAADDRSGHRGADVEADDQPELRDPELSHRQAGLHRFPVGVGPIQGSVHRRPCRCLGLHALHDRSAAGRPARAAAPALRGGRARRRARRASCSSASPCRCCCPTSSRRSCSGCSTASSSSTSSTP